MSDDDTALADSPLTKAAIEAMVEQCRAKMTRIESAAPSLAWAIAKGHVTDRAVAQQRAEDRAAGEDCPADVAITLMQRALSIVEEIAAERTAGRVFADAAAAPLGTYGPEVLRARLLAAIREEEAGYRPDMTPVERRDHGIRRLAAAWQDCTGKKAKVSYNSKDGVEMPTPFGRFAEFLFSDVGLKISPRQIRRAMHEPNPKKTL